MAITREQLYASIEEWLGPPDEIQRFDEEGAALPLDLFVYFPREDEDLFTSAFLTVGLSMREMGEVCPHAELSLDVLGRLTPEERSASGRALVDFVRARLAGGEVFVPNSVVRGVRLPPFDRMGSVLVTDWAKGSPQWLEDVEPGVRALRLMPLFESEVASVEEVGDFDAITAFRRSGTKVTDPQRRPLDNFLNHLM